ncbi:hypothetical protein K2173_006705 [Erythroxylum novogranatense]|uniref:Adenosylmethionine decarboxylase n=1 Tax=Erythroxylum novogranatense TaxID=1862640 RepID=A0AAV8TD77_9ROSI|nr:hypothetical protein K2173_006705 [Erythroxylum novogranatense]
MMIDTTPPPSPIDFEGFEKHLKITFYKLPFSNPTNFDSYVLFESSLFIYPLKIILKTCGTTKLLRSIVPLLKLADSLSLYIINVKYSRDRFIFPNYQLAPHQNFAEEVAILNKFFGILNATAYVLNNPNVTPHSRKTRTRHRRLKMGNDQIDVVTLKMCMPSLDRQKFQPMYLMNGIEGASLSTMHLTLEEGFSYASYDGVQLHV